MNPTLHPFPLLLIRFFSLPSQGRLSLHSDFFVFYPFFFPLLLVRHLCLSLSTLVSVLPLCLLGRTLVCASRVLPSTIRRP
jgi:hypothetical protein